MSDDKESGMKSAYELAMEKLEQAGGKSVKLTEEQLAEVADVDSKTRAKIAELEILITQRIAEAVGTGQAGDAARLKAELALEVRKITDQGESEKEALRSSWGDAASAT